MFARIGIWLLVATLLPIAVGCLHVERDVTFENRSGEVILVEFQSTELRLDPNEVRALRTRKNLFPSRVRVIDEAGETLLDLNMSWEDLEERQFIISIE